MSAAHQHGHGGGGHGDPGDDGTTGMHGMLLFGSETLYLSHLPMFGRPHNFQVILEVALDDDAADALRADREAGGDLHTFTPDEFPMTELDPSGAGPERTVVEGTVVRGHFERGGRPLTTATARVLRVVHYRELDVAAAHDVDRGLTYLCFGRPGQFHLAHEITGRPDFDQVLTAELVPGSVTDQAGRPAGEVTGGFALAQPVLFEERKDTPAARLTPDETTSGFFFRSVGPNGSHGFRAELTVVGEWYLELGDLGSA
jgi:hypothetical protein